ncbi:hypothetical protein NZK35_15690 [Stieleria sp. ICT_E10.1]|uniref:hypothetical protein n=1 Tax=Stieleria sedimenti TaxID=2976331 RepID=UPI00217F67BB|nr:hypothetical protein [Stieleria sedimenti]MCS7468094.1 hypothetical protein [Stieleria sedimenti]
MSLSAEVIRILGERATHQINFNLGRCRIDPPAFSRVQSMLRRYEIGVQTDPDLPDRARYDRNGPTLFLWSDADENQIRSDADSKALIVHECVHVITHSQASRAIDVVEDETVAFLAQTLYRLAIQGYTHQGSGERGGEYSRTIHHFRDRPTGRIFDAAQQIVFDHEMLDQTACTPLFDRDVERLREAIRAHPAYSTLAS